MLGHDEEVRATISVCSGVSPETGGLSIDLSAFRGRLQFRSTSTEAPASLSGHNGVGSSRPETATKNAIERECGDFSLLANATLMLVESL